MENVRGDHQRCRLVQQVDRREIAGLASRELDVGLVHDEDASVARNRLECRPHGCGVLDGAGRVVGCAQEQHVRALGGGEASDRFGTDAEVRPAGCHHDFSTDDAGDVRVQGVSR